MSDKKTVRVMVFVPVTEPYPENPHEWHSYPDGKVLMGRPVTGFHYISGFTHRKLHASASVKFKELRDVTI